MTALLIVIYISHLHFIFGSRQMMRLDRSGNFPIIWCSTSVVTSSYTTTYTWTTTWLRMDNIHSSQFVVSVVHCYWWCCPASHLTTSSESTRWSVSTLYCAVVDLPIYFTILNISCYSFVVSNILRYFMQTSINGW